MEKQSLVRLKEITCHKTTATEIIWTLKDYFPASREKDYVKMI